MEHGQQGSQYHDHQPRHGYWSGGSISGSGTLNNTATGILDITFTGGSQQLVF
ncbi:MAG: hypothetical protein IPM46_01450 [Flavobacteriales bacterium]|nr:hypothetical protein [Flavobacteriales bacterium]